jgi:hypothetical protein
MVKQTEKTQTISYRPDSGIRQAVLQLSEEHDRSINWMLNEIVKKGLACLAAQKSQAQANGHAEH